VYLYDITVVVAKTYKRFGRIVSTTRNKIGSLRRKGYETPTTTSIGIEFKGKGSKEVQGSLNSLFLYHVTSIMSPSSDVALEHLRKIKPNDGWSIERKDGGSTNLVRLMRRKVPLTDSYFLDIHYDATNSRQVVGILTTGSGKVQAQVLVHTDGRPAGDKISLISISGYPVNASTVSSTRTSNSSSSNVPSTNQATSNLPILTDAQNRDLMMYGGAVMVAAVLFRILASSVASISVLLIPIAYFYLISTCPTVESFDAKRELKRILRGHHLPEDHPEKPRGILSETIARIQASVTTEIATLPGYEVTLVPLAGAAIIACTRVPSVQKDFYWIGAAKKWTYVYEADIRNDGNVR
jgi:hypothetical protein